MNLDCIHCYLEGNQLTKETLDQGKLLCATIGRGQAAGIHGCDSSTNIRPNSEGSLHSRYDFLARSQKHYYSPPVQLPPQFKSFVSLLRKKITPEGQNLDQFRTCGRRKFSSSPSLKALCFPYAGLRVSTLTAS